MRTHEKSHHGFNAHWLTCHRPQGAQPAAMIADALHSVQEPSSQVERINTADMELPLAKTGQAIEAAGQEGVGVNTKSPDIPNRIHVFNHVRGYSASNKFDSGSVHE
jgi:hypothetical protein